MTSLKEKIKVYEALLHQLAGAYAISLNPDHVKRLLENIANWSYAHRVGNGEYSEKEQQRLVDAAFQKLGKLD